MSYDVIVAGHICLDLAPGFDQSRKRTMEEIFIPGKLVNMKEITISTGGPVSNTGIALTKLGISTQLMGKLGNDELGSLVLDMLGEIGAADYMTVVEGEETSYTVVIVPPGYDRIFLHNPGANNTFCADDIDYEAVAKAKLFHFGYPPLMKQMYANEGHELIEIFKRVKKLGVTTSLDMSLPDANSASGKTDWDKLLKNLLPYVDLYLPSVEETMFMIDRDSFNRLNDDSSGGDLLDALDMNALQKLGKQLLSYGAKIAAIKCGVKGFYIGTSSAERLSEIGAAKPGDINNWSNRELHEESFYVPRVASATGSGDSSIAGFIAAYLRGMDIEDSIQTACSLGGQNVQTMDALSGIHNWDDSRAMIDGWEKNRLTIGGDYWKYCSDKKIWAGKEDKKYG